MGAFKVISADSHIVEPPDMYIARINPKFRDRAPRMERRKTPTGREYDAWVLDGMQVGTLGVGMQAGQRFEDPSQIDFLGIWEDVRKGAYDADALLERMESAGIAVTTDPEWNDPSVGQFARIHDPEGNPIELWEPDEA